MKALVCAVVAFCVTVSLADGNAKLHRGRPKGVAMHSGGIVEKIYNGNVLRIQNAQKLVPQDELAALTQKIRWTSLIPVELISKVIANPSCPIVDANDLVAQDKVGAGVLLIEDTKLPIILTSPDSRWSILNVAKLVSDNPTREKLVERFTKVYWGAVARALGVGNSGYSGCVLVPFTNLKELDRISVLQPCPEPFNKMITSAAAYGIRTLSISSYRTACMEGWAPAPTNDVQKAIWKETHTIPDKPLTMQYDPKKDK